MCFKVCFIGSGSSLCVFCPIKLCPSCCLAVWDGRWTQWNNLSVNYRLHFVLKGSHSLDDPSCTLIHFSQVCVRSCNQITRFGIMSAPICFLWPQNCPVRTLCNSWVQSGCVVATAAPEPTLGQQTYQASVRALRWSWNWEANRSCDRHTAAVAGV